MSESARKVVIRADRTHPDWCTAEGRNLLAATAAVLSVERTPSGIAFHRDFRDEIISALDRAGYQIIEDKRPTATPTPAPARHGSWDHMRYVSDDNDLILLPPDTPGGHWRDESSECRRCNPAHDPTPAIAEAKHAVAETLAAMRARSAQLSNPEHTSNRPPEDTTR